MGGRGSTGLRNFYKSQKYLGEIKTTAQHMVLIYISPADINSTSSNVCKDFHISYNGCQVNFTK